MYHDILLHGTNKQFIYILCSRFMRGDPPLCARRTIGAGHGGAQPIIAEQFAAGRGGPRGADK